MGGANEEKVLIIDLGSRYSFSAARKVRDLGVYSEIVPGSISPDEINFRELKGIIVCGEKKAKLEKSLKEQFKKLPVLRIEPERNAVEDEQLKKFLYDKCSCSGEWSPEAFIEAQIDKIREQVKDRVVLCGLSGGVDSSVAAAIVEKAVGEQLKCIFVNHGLLRQGEVSQVKNTFSERFDLDLHYVDASKEFISALKGVSDPERKRNIIGEKFIRIFERTADKLGRVDFLVQGTLYSDVIESGQGTEENVKSHHNVGGLPEDMSLELIEPLYYLFKDEARSVGEHLGLPEEIVWRQPFPGPGLAVRVLGEVTLKKLEIVRRADAVVRKEIKKAGLDRDIWQYFAVLPEFKSVGVSDNQRSYGYTAAVRAVNSIDAMSAGWTRLPDELLEVLSERIIDECDEITRVVYDITDKPPATIEWE